MEKEATGLTTGPVDETQNSIENVVFGPYIISIVKDEQGRFLKVTEVRVIRSFMDILDVVKKTRPWLDYPTDPEEIEDE